MKRFLLCFLILIIASCDKSYVSNIPNFPVNIEIDLTFEGKELVGIHSYKTYTQSNISNFIRYIGFGGVLVYHGIGDGMGAYYAYDLSCPHEAQKTTLIEVKGDNLTAICPKCNSEFSLEAAGSSISGPANEERYSLKSYKVLQTGNNKLFIYNPNY